MACGHSGILPSNIREANEVFYPTNRRSWRCKKCNLGYQSKARRSSLEVRMAMRLRGARHRAKQRSHEPPIISVEEAVKLYKSQAGKCAFCKRCVQEVSELSLEHNHRTGEVRGFVCNNCNLLEGILDKFSDEEFENFILRERGIRVL